MFSAALRGLSPRLRERGEERATLARLPRSASARFRVGVDVKRD